MNQNPLELKKIKLTFYLVHSPTPPKPTILTVYMCDKNF